MEASEFDKHYAAKMRKAGAPDLSEEDWGPLASTLQARQRRRWRAIPLWWFGALAFALLGSNLFWWRMWSTQQKAVNALELAWQQNRPPLPSHQKETIYHYDTLYRTVYVREVLPAITAPAVLPEATGFQNFTSAPAQASAPATSPDTLASEAAALTNAGETPLTHYSCGDIPPIPAAEIPIPVETYSIRSFPIAVATKHARAKFFHPEILVPKKVRLGAFSGMSTPTGSGLSNTVGGSVTLNAELLFSKHLALSLDAVYGGFDFRSSTDRADYGFPAINSPGDDYQLQYLSTEEGWWTYAGFAAGMRYYFSGKDRWDPYIGLGYGLRRLLPAELGGKFLNTQTGKSKDFSVENESHAPTAAYLDAQLGLRYRLLKRLYWQSAGKFQYKVDKSQKGMPQYWEFSTGAVWAF